ncbi:MAG: glutamate--tRNA ligase [SAR86 cluster bacterium SAR86A]|uniref:Glutamate--tRNA ligase n=1 Tax=SAR86 cluster bacterium SAR86A TaxID=1123866 RepID=J4V0H7_9GAMM|nr:MAG: glutamate--tRNA ligase [SAR86 cluster bacterium SAR86A]
MSKVVTRFAPSPTGTLHIGGVRTALFNYVYAKQNEGLFLVRIEDTDKERSKKEYEKNILDSLASIGLSPDEKPINQSERNDVYVDAAKKIFDSGNAYWCDCSKEELEEMRKQQEKDGKKPMYDGRSRNKGLKQSENTVLRLATPEDGEIIVNDLIRGKVVFQNSELDDLILLRSDGTPTYHLCNVVDDFEQNVTTVIRGEDHLSNTPRQIHIQNALGYPALEYAHLPLVLGPDKRRLSKRHAATSLEEYKSDGYLDSAILNTLARLGWSKGDQEVFYMEDLIRDFNIRDVQKAGAIFDITKLDWLNTQHIANLSFEDFKKELKPFLKDLSIDIDNHQNVDLLLSSMRTVESTFKKIADDLIPYYFEVNTYNQQAIDKFVDNEGLKILNDLSEILLSIDEWSENNIDNALKNYQNENNCPVPKVNQPIRIALTGSTKSPSLGLTLAIFGKNEALKRIDNLIDHIG